MYNQYVQSLEYFNSSLLSLNGAKSKVSREIVRVQGKLSEKASELLTEYAELKGGGSPSSEAIFWIERVVLSEEFQRELSVLREKTPTETGEG